MTVAELIEKLSNLPQDGKVYIEDHTRDDGHLLDIRHVNQLHEGAMVIVLLDEHPYLRINNENR